MGKRAALVFALVVLGLGLALRLSGFDLSAEGLAALVRQAGTASWGPALYIALYVVLTTVAAPAMLFHIAAGVLWGFGPGALLSILASNLVTNLQFALGRLYGSGPLRSLVERKGMARLFDRARTEGPWLMFAIRQVPLPVPFVTVCVAAGASPMPWWHFLVGSGLGGLVPLLIWTWFADEAFHDATAGRSAILVKALLAGTAALVVAVGGRWIAGKVRAPLQPPGDPGVGGAEGSLGSADQKSKKLNH